ncbi:26S proteasome non-ATPase regulatory subunit 7 [Plecturocebus cupreus]
MKPKDLGLPTEAYISVEEVHDDGTPTSKTFEHVTMDHKPGPWFEGTELQPSGYQKLLEKVATGKLPINHQIIYQLQDIFNLLPDISLQEFVKVFSLKTNNQLVVMYLASLIHSVDHQQQDCQLGCREERRAGERRD